MQGQDPGYDPLAFIVDEAHRRNLELHAWYNPYRVSMQADPSKLVPEHPARVHPEWIWAYGGKLYFDPGLPEAQEHIQRAILHSVEHYDLDGVHFDDYFYPYPVAGQTIPDAATYAAHGAGFDDIADWRRHNVDTFVSSVSERIKALKPWVKFGISPFGIWRNRATDPLGSETGGSQSYDLQFADTRKWVLEGWLDYINPQIYWQFGLAVADYAKLVPWWADVAATSGTHLYIGEALYKVTSGVFTDPAELSNHLTFDREIDAARHPRARQRVLLGQARARRPAGLDDAGARRPLRAPGDRAGHGVVARDGGAHSGAQRTGTHGRGRRPAVVRCCAAPGSCDLVRRLPRRGRSTALISRTPRR